MANSKLAIFAHWDKDNLIDDTDIYYLKELKKVCDKIIFVSDCEIEENELKKLDNIADKIIAYKHGEYDFGSYKRGYIFAKENNLLREFDELIFANNSCIGPLVPFRTIFDAMKNTEADFWGISKFRYFGITHLQSFFIVFKKQIFISKIFENFILGITKQEQKIDIIKKYELGLSKKLTENNFKMAAFISSKNYVDITNLKFLYKFKAPFIKKSLLKQYSILLFLNLVNETCTNTNYLMPLLKNFRKRYKSKNSLFSTFKYLRQLIIRIHLEEGRILLFNKWYKCYKKGKNT